MFSCEFYKIVKNTLFIEHLWVRASTVSVITSLKTWYQNQITVYTVWMLTLYFIMLQNGQTYFKNLCNIVK